MRSLDRTCPGDATTCSGGTVQGQQWTLQRNCPPGTRCNANKGTCAQCPSEIADFKDNDCDGEVDEDFRKTLTTIEIQPFSGGRDHCFARGNGSNQRCIYTGSAGGKSTLSQYRYEIYELGVGSGSFVTVGNFQLSKLMACYAPGYTEHRYLPIDSNRYQNQIKGDQAWTCDPIGYVETGQSGPNVTLAPGTDLIYLHYSKTHTDRLYIHESTPYGSSYQVGKIWHAWRP
ncbi:MAG: hypothetical protein ABEN55_13665 [Bradymonadaceae bacterium]